MDKHVALKDKHVALVALKDKTYNLGSPERQNM